MSAMQHENEHRLHLFFREGLGDAVVTAACCTLLEDEDGNAHERACNAGDASSKCAHVLVLTHTRQAGACCMLHANASAVP